MPRRVKYISLLIAMAVPNGSLGQQLTGHWQAFSKSAEGITGDIDLSETLLRFSDGQSLQLQYLRDGPEVGLGIGDRAAKIFKIVDSRPLRLLHGKTLCFSPATYFTAAVDTNGLLVLTVFSGGEPPVVPIESETNRLCASYVFSQARPPAP